MKVCVGCKKPIPPTADSYRDHEMRVVCVPCYLKWLAASRG